MPGESRKLLQMMSVTDFSLGCLYLFILLKCALSFSVDSTSSQELPGTKNFLGTNPWVRSSVARVQERRATSGQAQCQGTEKYMDMKLDHFDFTNDQTFKLRYFIADNYQSIQNRPIFFYTGNEGDIVLFCNNTGILWDMAPEFNAVVIFAEHRYYGKTLPFGSESFKDAAHLKYLTSEQALADFAYVIKKIKEDDATLARSPVIAFGGSYGGMLAAWMRMKYPNVIAGALAASAPIWNFVGQKECNAAYKIITKDFETSGDNCKPGIRSSWDVLTKMGQTEKGRDQIMSLLSLCYPVQSQEDVQQVKSWLAETWFNLAMVDYPYPANFLEPLPGFPIKVVCSKFTSPNATGSNLLLEIKGALGVYYNYTGQASCFNISQTDSGSLNDAGWNWQFCTEMVVPYCTDGVTDMFEPSPWDLSAYVKNCQKQFGVTPRDDWVETYYWGKNITSASNIFFSNGALDPWSAGGVLKSQSETLQAFVIPEGAHHLDIRSKTDMDPPGLIQARKMEKDAIYKWIKHYHKL